MSVSQKEFSHLSLSILFVLGLSACSSKPEEAQSSVMRDEVLVVQGYNMAGEQVACETHTVCTMIASSKQPIYDEFAKACENMGYESSQCECEEYVCSSPLETEKVIGFARPRDRVFPSSNEVACYRVLDAKACEGDFSSEMIDQDFHRKIESEIQSFVGQCESSNAEALDCGCGTVSVLCDRNISSN